MKMVDQNDKVSEERALSDGTQIKTCVDCGTSKTPLWRGGPAGPKSLCNACGIRSRKKRRALLGLIKEEKKAKKFTGFSSKCYSNNCNSTHMMHDNNSTSSYNNSSGSDENCSSSSKLGDFSLKKKLLAFGGDFALQRPRSSTNQRRKLGEVEQAAFLLMALSCGSVYA